jgi:hypothetical protein
MRNIQNDNDTDDTDSKIPNERRSVITMAQVFYDGLKVKDYQTSDLYLEMSESRRVSSAGGFQYWRFKDGSGHGMQTSYSVATK